MRINVLGTIPMKKKTNRTLWFSSLFAHGSNNLYHSTVQFRYAYSVVVMAQFSVRWDGVSCTWNRREIGNILCLIKSHIGSLANGCRYYVIIGSLSLCCLFFSRFFLYVCTLSLGMPSLCRSICLSLSVFWTFYIGNISELYRRNFDVRLFCIQPSVLCTKISYTHVNI